MFEIYAAHNAVADLTALRMASVADSQSSGKNMVLARPSARHRRQNWHLHYGSDDVDKSRLLFQAIALASR